MVYIVSRQAIKLCLILGDNTFVTLSFRPRGDSCMVKVEHTVLCEITCWLNIADSARLITVGFRRLSKAFHTLLRISKKREASIPKNEERGGEERSFGRQASGISTATPLSLAFSRAHTHTHTRGKDAGPFLLFLSGNQDTGSSYLQMIRSTCIDHLEPDLLQFPLCSCIPGPAVGRELRS
jgi:hypothetical protein